MKVLVTGGAGFIGSHLVRRLLSRGDTVTVLDNLDDAYDPAIKAHNLRGLDAEFVPADVRDLGAVTAAAEGAPVIVHLAARAGVRESLLDPLLYSSVNIDGTAVVLEAARRLGARVVFASSSSVYGSRAGGPFREEDPTDAPHSPYAATKKAGELLGYAAAMGSSVPVTCLRFFTVYGPRQRPAMAISRFLRRALAHEPLPLYGDGSSLRDYTYADDAVDALLAAIDRPQRWAVLNIGGGAPISLDGLVAAVSVAVDRPLTVERHPEQRGDVPRTHADISRAREVLGWAPKTPLAEGLAAAVAWMREG